MEPQTLLQLLSTGYYRIPASQRGYAWKEVHARDLLSDLQRARELQLSHYLGSIILRRDEGGSLKSEVEGKGAAGTINCHYIEDGQQRLTTCLLLLLAIYHRVCELDMPAPKTQLEAWLYLTRNHSPDKDLPRLANDQPDLDGFTAAIFARNEWKGRTSPPMNRMSKVKKCFDAELADCEKDELGQFMDFLTGRVTFNVATLSDAYEKALVFDTINSRGVALNAFDRVKNYAMYVDRLHEFGEDPAQSWYHCIELFDRAKLGESVDEDRFIAECLSVELGENVKPAKVHDKFIEWSGGLGEDDTGKWSRHIKLWRQLAPGYAQCSSGEYRRSKLDSNPSQGEKCLLTALDRIENLDYTGIVRKLIAAAMIENSEDAVAKLADACEKYLFRYHAVLGKRTDANQAWIAELAHRVANGTSLEDAVKKVRKMAMDFASLDRVLGELGDGKAKYNSARGVKGWDRIYYFLYEYESAEHNKGMPGLVWQAGKSQEKTQEHIVPQQPGEEWPDWGEDSAHHAFVHRLGNLVLTTENSKLGNKGWLEKKELYEREGAMQRERELIRYADGDSFTSNSILKREEAMIEWAKMRWRFEGEE
ncbi:DUF262 domain-containing HNH endonuclease family protein [bacterium]|nr:DUF262 domain-containing HNH endonuclease family protein [bacterium]